MLKLYSDTNAIWLQFVLVLIVTFDCALGILDGKCNDIVINGYNYEQEILIDGVDTTYQLMTVDYDYDQNFLFFSFTGSDGFNTAAYIDLDTNKIGTIEDICGGFGHKFDDTRKVLIEASDGIYEFDYEDKSGVKMNITDKDIWQIFTKDGVYFTAFADEQDFAYENDELNQVERIGENATLISVDTENNVYFYNSSGLFCLLHITGEINNMKLSILSELFALSSARKVDKISRCDRIIVNNTNHEKDNYEEILRQAISYLLQQRKLKKSSNKSVAQVQVKILYAIDGYPSEALIARHDEGRFSAAIDLTE